MMVTRLLFWIGNELVTSYVFFSNSDYKNRSFSRHFRNVVQIFIYYVNKYSLLLLKFFLFRIFE